MGWRELGLPPPHQRFVPNSLAPTTNHQAPRLVPLLQSTRHLLQDTPLLARETVEPFRGDLVEHAIHVVGLQVSRRALSGRRHCGRTLRGDRLALRNDLVHFLDTLTRARERAWNRAWRILGVRHLRDALTQLLDAHA